MAAMDGFQDLWLDVAEFAASQWDRIETFLIPYSIQIDIMWSQTIAFITSSRIFQLLLSIYQGTAFNGMWPKVAAFGSSILPWVYAVDLHGMAPKAAAFAGSRMSQFLPLIHPYVHESDFLLTVCVLGPLLLLAGFL
jgi:hypothetical protein